MAYLYVYIYMYICILQIYYGYITDILQIYYIYIKDILQIHTQIKTQQESLSIFVDTMTSAPGDHAQHLLLIQGHLHDAPDAGEHDGDLGPMLGASTCAFLQPF